MGNNGYRGAIPKVLILILSFWLGLPSPIGLGIIIIRALQKAIQPLPYGTLAYQMAEQSIWLLQILGLILFFITLYSIYKQFRRGEYF